MKALFIDQQFIKNTTPINENVDMKLLEMATLEAQELHLLESIGTGLYNDLADKILNDTLTNDDQVLMSIYITPMLKYWVMVEGLPMMLFKMTNKSISTSTSDNSQPVQYEDMKYLMNQAKAKAEVYTQRMIKYLQANISKFPLFYNAGNTIDTIFPSKERFTTNWNL
jgi:phosphatidate phosphatase APP1